MVIGIVGLFNIPMNFILKITNTKTSEIKDVECAELFNGFVSNQYTIKKLDETSDLIKGFVEFCNKFRRETYTHSNNNYVTNDNYTPSTRSTFDMCFDECDARNHYDDPMEDKYLPRAEECKRDMMIASCRGFSR